MQIHPPESVGMHTQRLERITPIMQDFVKDNRLPGIMTLIQRHGKVVHLGKFGMMDIEAGKPVQEDALFRIFSMTKPIISVALMMLLEEGRLSLRDPVSTFIPAFKTTKVFAGSTVLGLKLVDPDVEITLHHLLTHTAGLSYGWSFSLSCGRAVPSGSPDDLPPHPDACRGGRTYRAVALAVPAGNAVALQLRHRCSGSCDPGCGRYAAG